MSRPAEHVEPTLGQYAAGVLWVLLCSPLTLGVALSLAMWVGIAWAAKMILEVL